MWRTHFSISIMNWQINFSGLLLAALTFFISSCNNDDAGPVLTDQVPANALFTDTITVNSSVVLVNEDNITSNSNHILAGVYEDEYTGTVRAEAFAQLVRQGTQDLTGAVADSAVLVLRYTYSAGDTTAEQNLTVYPLTSDLNINTTYYSTSPAPSYNASAPVGSRTFQARPDTDDNLEVPLSLSYANELIQAAASENFSSQVKGLAIIPDVSMPGAVLGFNLVPNTSQVRVYYHTSTDDSLVLTANISNAGARFYRIIGDRTGTVLSQLQENYDSVSTENTENRGFLQAGTGIRTRLSFPYIQQLQEQFGNIVINKAEILVPLVDNTNDKIIQVGSIVLYEADAEGKIRQVNGNRKLVQSSHDQQASVSPLLVFFDPDNNRYQIPFTSYMQELVYGVKPSTGVFISPAADIPDFINLNRTTVNRSVLADQEFLGEQLKVRVYFSVIQ